MLFMAALGIGQAVFGGLSARSAAQAEAIINKANAAAENRVREANNVVKASQSALGNYLRSEDSKRKFKAAGEMYSKAGQNIVRLQDQAVRGTVGQRLQAAEQIGALTAQASAMGIGGSSVDMIAKQIRSSARGAMRDQESAVVTRVQDMKSQRLNLMDNANAASDQGQAFAGLDYSKAIAPFVPKPSYLGIAINALASEGASKYINAEIGEWQMNRAAKSDAASSGNYIRFSDPNASYIGTGPL